MVSKSKDTNPSPTGFRGRKPPPLRVLLFVAAVMLGFGVAGTGLNLLLINQGVRADPMIKVMMTVESCTGSTCRVTYERNNEVVRGTYFLQGKDAPTVNAVTDGYIYTSHKERVYPKTEVPLVFALGFLVTGVACLLFFGYRLYVFWRPER